MRLIALLSTPSHAEVYTVFAKTLTIKVPVGAAGGPVSVTNAVATGLSQVHFSVSGPQVSGIAPASGLPGDRVTISGSGLAEVTGVTFSRVPAEIAYASATSLQVRVPVGATTGRISVTTGTGTGTASSVTNFSVN